LGEFWKFFTISLFNNSHNLSQNALQINNNNQSNNINNNNENNNNNLNQNNFMNINPLLVNQRQIMLNAMNNNNNIANQNMYFSPNINNMNNMQNNNMFNPNNKNDINFIMLRKKEENLINNCVTLCKEQLECRLLQKKIDEEPSIASNIIYDKISFK